jgi:hypothetical protein
MAAVVTAGLIWTQIRTSQITHGIQQQLDEIRRHQETERLGQLDCMEQGLGRVERTLEERRQEQAGAERRSSGDQERFCPGRLKDDFGLSDLGNLVLDDGQSFIPKCALLSPAVNNVPSPSDLPKPW